MIHPPRARRLPVRRPRGRRDRARGRRGPVHPAVDRPLPAPARPAAAPRHRHGLPAARRPGLGPRPLLRAAAGRADALLGALPGPRGAGPLHARGRRGPGVPDPLRGRVALGGHVPRPRPGTAAAARPPRPAAGAERQPLLRLHRVLREHRPPAVGDRAAGAGAGGAVRPARGAAGPAGRGHLLHPRAVVRVPAPVGGVSSPPSGTRRRDARGARGRSSPPRSGCSCPGCT